MDWIDKLGDAFTTTGKEVANLAKDVSGSAKLNIKLKDEELNKSKLFYKLGKKYYESNPICPDESVEDLFEEIEKCDVRITQLKEEISLKKGMRICPDCGSQYPQTNGFCNKCGRENSDLR